MASTYVAKRLWSDVRAFASGSLAVLLLTGTAPPARADASYEARFEGAVLSIVEATPLAVSLVEAALPLAENDRLLFLTVNLSPGWKTYWRLPGRFGLAPIWDWSGSSNIDDLVVHYPAPILFDEAGGSSIGYDAVTVWPMVVSPGDADAPMVLNLSLSFGLCADLCVPETAQFRLGEEGSRAVSPQLSILAGLARRLPKDGGLAELEAYGPTSGAIHVFEGVEGQHMMVASEQVSNETNTSPLAMRSDWPYDQPAAWLHVIEPGHSVRTFDLRGEPPTVGGQ